MSVERSPLPNMVVSVGMVVALMMATGILWMPSILGVMKGVFQIDAREVGRLASAEAGAFLVATIYASGKPLAALKRLALIGCALLMGANIALVLARDVVPLMPMRVLAGFGTGVGASLVMKVCAMSATPTRFFGIYSASFSVVMILGFQFIGHLVSAWAGEASSVDGLIRVATAVWGVHAALAALASLLLIIGMRGVAREPSAGAARDSAGQAIGVQAAIGLSAIALFFLARGNVWPFLQVMGGSHGFAVTGVANALSMFAVFGVLGSLAAAAIPPAVARSYAIGVAVLALFGGLYALYAPASLLWYTIGCAIGGFFWNFVFALGLGLLARIDATGRACVLGMTVSSAGSAAGPYLAGMLIEGSGYQSVAWLAGGLCAAGFIGVALAETRRVPVEAGTAA
ncbi:hypothetical protein [Azoarcus sp. DN11]|uniref:hypothetical protein n=1 Tax=Azoarcus sp. DN11 TaxID=356837 RepID=UPI000EAC0DA4|nr:hypothetical protein [Azoarcus sp. DN11]AYH43521.1 hypothetical protein CDA09_09020 [Azoarcus sp. DN11]